MEISYDTTTHLGHVFRLEQGLSKLEFRSTIGCARLGLACTLPIMLSYLIFQS